ncbi:MAG: glycosyltransferase family 4 protein [Flavobacteriales bacterium]|nr:glycosyltransferase family 4 protein [Flavobacteriales bacterium]
MHIAIVTDGITPFVTGGMQRHSHHLVKQLLKRGVDVSCVHCVYGDSNLPSEQEVIDSFQVNSGNLTVYTMRFPSLRNIPGHYIRESYKYSCDIYELLEDQWGEFDFIYSKGYTSWRLLEEKKKGKHMAPVGVKFHGYEMFQKNKNLKIRIEQFMLRPPVVFMNRNADVIFSYGGEINEIIERIGVDSEKIISIGSGIDDSWILEDPISETSIRKFLFIGRNEKRKGLDDLKAISSEIEKLPVEFHFVGPIPQTKQINSSNCIYHGEVKEVNALRSIIDSCHILVSPSHSEGMPNVILEAMARGLAILATEVGAVPMMVSNTNGRLIKSRSRKLLVDALNYLAYLPKKQLLDLRKNSLRKIDQNYRWSFVAEQTYKAIEKATFTNS